MYTALKDNKIIAISEKKEIKIHIEDGGYNSRDNR